VFITMWSHPIITLLKISTSLLYSILSDLLGVCFVPEIKETEKLNNILETDQKQLMLHFQCLPSSLPGKRC
jgi:hypothetical protein